MRTLILSLVLLLPALSLAETTAPISAPAPVVTAPAKAKVTPPVSPLDTNHDGVVDAAETAAATTAPATVNDVIKDGADIVEAAKGLKDQSLPKGLAITILLGAIFKLLLSLLKVVANNVGWKWFASQDGKRVIKYSTLGLGAAAALCANLAFGMNWIQAIMILLSGPIAVAIHEYTSDSKPVDPVKA